MDGIVEAIFWFVDLVIPDKDSRFRRVQKIGCVLFGGLGIVALVAALFEVFGGS